MNFLTMQQELGYRLNYDPTNTVDQTKLKRWLNMAQQYICGKKLWPFMMAEEIVQTVIDYTTGTATVAAADTAVTFSATLPTQKRINTFNLHLQMIGIRSQHTPPGQTRPPFPRRRQRLIHLLLTQSGSFFMRQPRP